MSGALQTWLTNIVFATVKDDFVASHSRGDCVQTIDQSQAEFSALHGF